MLFLAPYFLDLHPPPPQHTHTTTVYDVKVPLTILFVYSD